MPFSVLMTDDAAQDLYVIYEYIAAHDTPPKAGHVLGQIEKNLLSLSDFPDRGAHPKELSALGIREYRAIFFKPYRIIYRLIGENVYVMLICNGRRDMQSLLQRRLLGG